MHVNYLKDWALAKNPPLPIDKNDEILSALTLSQLDWIPFSGICQVHDVLIQQGIVPDTVLDNAASDYLKDVSLCDWVYKTEFSAEKEDCRYLLRCAGLDTVCDLFVNGTYLGRSESMYLPFEADVTPYLSKGEANTLFLYFHNHRKAVAHYDETMPEEFRGVIAPKALMHKSEDYATYEAEKDSRGYSPIGIFDEVTLTEVETIDWKTPQINVFMNENYNSYDRAVVRFRLEGGVYRPGEVKVHVAVADKNGLAVGELWTDPVFAEESYLLNTELSVENPDLWWPKNYGEQPLYRAAFSFYWNGQLIGNVEKTFGIRSIKMTGNMRFNCNGVNIRLWGGNFAPIYGPSNVFNRDVTLDLIDKIDKVGMNVIRVWGPSNPYKDCFYDEMDRRGILVWQDFPTGSCTTLPWTGKFYEMYKKEAYAMIERLRNHPSIFMWCGGNENIYMYEYLEECPDHGFELLQHDFKDICSKEDLYRIYYVSCPYGGNYTNDPDFGDAHGSRAYRRFIPGEPYGVFFSENIRCYPPQYRSMKRWLGDRIWEDGYVDIKPFGCVKAMPSTWRDLLGNFGEEKIGPIEDFYAATNPQELVYKYTAAACQDLYQMFARSRRGNPAYCAADNNTCQGFMIWKLNDPWPSFYCSLVDYYGECAMSYYAIKRAIKPVWIDLEVADPAEDFRGTVELTAYRMDEEKITREMTLPVAFQKGRSNVVVNLDSWGPLHWFTVICARLYNEKGELVHTCHTLLKKENMLPFPNAKLTLEQEGDVLTVRTDKYAHCVELSAGAEGLEFGWMFEDNFFDLLPFEEKKVRILKRGSGDCIRAKAQYSNEAAFVSAK